jgi:hypothetical protein
VGAIRSRNWGEEREGSGIAVQGAVGKNTGTKAAAAVEPLVRAGAEGLVHPVAGAAFLDAGEADILEIERGADEGGEIGVANDDVTAHRGREGVGEIEFALERFEDFDGEERDLAFVILFEVVEAVAADAFAGDTIDMIDFDDGMLAGGLIVVTEEVVVGGDEEVTDADHDGAEVVTWRGECEEEGPWRCY